jgi:hypothetical protein
VRTIQLVELVRIKSYNHALITLLPLYCALIKGIMLVLRTVNSGVGELANGALNQVYGGE